MGKVVDDINATDRQTIGILGIGIYHRQGVFQNTLHSAVTASPLFTDYSTLFVDFLSVQVDEAGPVMQNQQARVYYTRIFSRYVADIVNGLVYTCISIQVRSEFDAFGLTPGNDAQMFSVTGKILGTIECHVFQEVCQSPLLGLF